MSVRILPYGERAVLLELGSTSLVIGAYDAVRALGLDGVEDVVPAAATVLVVFVDGPALQRALPALQAIEPSASSHEPGELVTIAVSYDGPDLEEVAALTGLGTDEVVALHCSAEYTVAFNGFSPGFSYLIGLDERLHVPRRESPRTAVPPGSVALSGEFTAVYPRRSPGGWRLLGCTETAMWDGARTPPSLLVPGMRVRFEPR